MQAHAEAEAEVKLAAALAAATSMGERQGDEAESRAAVRERRNYLKANIATVLAIAIAATAVWITAMSWVQAHGIGPTHFGQSADPLKREGPGALVFFADGVALALVALLARFAVRGFRSDR